MRRGVYLQINFRFYAHLRVQTRELRVFGTQTKGNVKNFGPTNLVTRGGSLLDEEHMEDPRWIKNTWELLVKETPKETFTSSQFQGEFPLNSQAPITIPNEFGTFCSRPQAPWSTKTLGTNFLNNGNDSHATKNMGYPRMDPHNNL